MHLTKQVQPTIWFSSATGPQEVVSRFLGTLLQILRVLQKCRFVLIEGNQTFLYTCVSYTLVMGDVSVKK